MSATVHTQQMTEAAIRPHILRGSIWMILMRWGMGGIGLVSTIILARLLTPADFGLVAMAMLIVGIIEIFGGTGQQLALIRLASPTREHFDSAWTAQILVNLILGTTILLAAPFGAMYFDEPRVTLVMQVISIRVYVIGFENIGVAIFRKELDFAKDFRYGIYRKLIAFVFTIALALSLRNYWALIWGGVIGQIGAVALSYVMHPYRPRPCFRKIREIWSFSIWMLASEVGSHFFKKTDHYIIASFATPQFLGHYTIGAELASTPSAQLIFPMSRALLPNYAKLSHDPKQLACAYLNVLSVVVILAASTATGMAMVAEDLVLLLLGPQWTYSATFMVWFAFASGIGACSNTALFVLQAAADPRRVAFQSWTRVVIVVPALLAAVQFGGIETVAPAFLLAVMLLVPTFIYNLKAVIPVTISQILRLVWRPIIAAASMAMAVASISAALSGYSPILRLALEVPVGVFVFSVMLYFLWLVAGRPAGAERAGLTYVSGRLNILIPAIRESKRA